MRSPLIINKRQIWGDILGRFSSQRQPDKKNEEIKKYQKALQTLAEASEGALRGALLGFEYLFTGVAGSEWQIAKDAKTTLRGCYVESGWALTPATPELIISGYVYRTSDGRAIIFDRAGDVLGAVELHYVQGKVISIFWKRKLIARRR
jgi:hypothetical protein